MPRHLPFDSARRLWLALPALTLAGRPALAQDSAPVQQPLTPGPRAFMDRAFAMQSLAADSGDQAYGAVVVQGSTIIAEAPSRVVTRPDPTAHAEMEALREAARRLGTRGLSGCVMYSSSRPCPMCEAAAYWAGIDAMFHGQEIAAAGAPRLTRC